MKPEQLDIHFDICANNHGGVRESKEAHQSIKPTKAKMWDSILRYISRCGDFGATAYEVEKGLKIKTQTTSARMSELKKAKKIVPSGKRRPTDSGRMAAVFVCEEI